MTEDRKIDKKTWAKLMAEMTHMPLQIFEEQEPEYSREQILADLRQTAITFDAVGDTIHAKPLISILARAHGKRFVEMYLELLGKDPA